MQNSENRADITKLTGQAMKLIDLIDYQVDSVVSRTIIDKSIN